MGISDTADDESLLSELEIASRFLEGPSGCNRFFYVKTDTRYYSPVNSGRLLIDDADLLSITSLKTDEDDDFDYDYTWATTDYFLEPLNRIPKWKITVKPNGSYSFPCGTNTVQIVGSWGYGDGESATPYIDSETNTNEALDASETEIDTLDGTKFAAGMTLLVESEQMYVTATAGNTPTVKRGVNGTTAATHDTNKDIYIYRYPEGIKKACLLLAAKGFQMKNPFGFMGNSEMGAAFAGRLVDVRVAEYISEYVRSSVV